MRRSSFYFDSGGAMIRAFNSNGAHMDWLDWLTGILAGAVVLLALREPIGRDGGAPPDE